MTQYNGLVSRALTYVSVCCGTSRSYIQETESVIRSILIHFANTGKPRRVNPPVHVLRAVFHDEMCRGFGQ